MFGSNIVEIAIGLVFVYLTLALVVSSTNEFIAALTRARARQLESGIRNLLTGQSALSVRWWQRWLPHKKSAPPNPWPEAFFAHPLINALSKTDEMPSYIPSRAFATVLLHLVERVSVNANDASRAALLSGPMMPGMRKFDEIRGALDKIDNVFVKDALLSLLEVARSETSSAVTDVENFRERIEAWYESAMDRVNGWYKRQTQWSLLAISFAFAVVLNVDTISICRNLGRNGPLRDSVVAAATKIADQNTPTASGKSGNNDCQDLSTGLQQVAQGVEQLNGLGIPLGWYQGSREISNAKRDGTIAGAAVREAQHAVDMAAASASVKTATLSDRRALNDARVKLRNADMKADDERIRLVRLTAAGSTVPPDSDLYAVFHSGWLVFITKIGGLLVTAFAASLGAPFWFDVLNKFVSLRSSGRRPAKKHLTSEKDDVPADDSTPHDELDKSGKK